MNILWFLFCINGGSSSDTHLGLRKNYLSCTFLSPRLFCGYLDRSVSLAAPLEALVGYNRMKPSVIISIYNTDTDVMWHLLVNNIRYPLVPLRLFRISVVELNLVSFYNEDV